MWVTTIPRCLLRLRLAIVLVILLLLQPLQALEGSASSAGLDGLTNVQHVGRRRELRKVLDLRRHGWQVEAEQRRRLIRKSTAPILGTQCSV